MQRDENFAAYYCARIRGMKSNLLGQSQLEAMLDADDLAYLENALLESPYAEDLAQARARLEGADAIEDAVSRNLVRTFQHLQKNARGTFRELTAIVFTRWDLIAVKMLLRLRRHNVVGEEAIQSITPGPTLTIALIKDFLERDSMGALVEGLKAWNPELCVGLDEAMGTYRETERVEVLEEALDRAYFVDNARRLADWSGDDAQYVREFLRMEIDRINLRTIFAFRGAGASAQEILERMLPDGHLPRKALRGMAEASSPENAMEFLGSTRYSDFIEGLYQYIQTGMFSRMERYFELLLLQRVRRIARVEGTSIAVLIHYLWLKYNEVVNLRLIARGKARHLPRGLVREEVLYA